MTVEQVLKLLETAVGAEAMFMQQYLRRQDLLHAAEAKARMRALATFREVVLHQLERERDS
ncbi:MAG: hypothetical protein ACE5HB_10310 [Terriglobia bacterium]